jgi:hypothetical protein
MDGGLCSPFENSQEELKIIAAAVIAEVVVRKATNTSLALTMCWA